ncbi:MAG: Hpt domain-containing protein [Spirochaetota bacterium]
MNEKLIELLTSFEDGDLVTAAEIVEKADALLESDPSDPAVASVAEEISARFRSVARTGDTEGLDDDRERWIAILRPTNESALPFIESAVGHLSAIVDMLKRYRDGDLTLATEILAETQQLANNPNTPSDAMPFIRNVRDTFFEHVRAGTVVDLDEMEHESAEPTEPVQQRLPDAEPSEAAPQRVPTAESHDVPVDDLDVVTSFIQEAVDHLDDIEHRVLNLENDYDDELVNSIFRSVHTIKGVASFVGFSYVSETSHELETLLDDIRNDALRVNDDVVTVLLDGTDVLCRIVHGMEAQLASEGRSNRDSITEQSFGHLQIVARVREIRARDAQAPDQAETARVPQTPAAPATESSAWPTLRETEQAPVENAPIVSKEMIDAFIEESTDLLDEVEQQLLSAETKPVPHETVDRIFRSIQTVKGNAGFFWFSQVEERCMHMEGALDEYRKRGASLDKEAAGRFIDMLDGVRRSVAQVAEAAATTGEKAESADAAGSTHGNTGSNPLGEILLEMGEITEEALQQALTRQQRRLGEILVEENHVKPESVERALAEQADRRTDAPGATPEYSVTRKDIRVDTNKLDKLFDLVGELITAESMVLGGLQESTASASRNRTNGQLSSSGTEAGSNGNGGESNGTEALAHENGASIQKAASYLQKITREMQEITLSIRMIPLEATFGKMRRLVRDLARRFEKDVAIQISGEQTEMDKNVIEEISDPLVHVIRNAIDHGIETATERLAVGKPAGGTIRLSAKHEGNEIWITVQDDGRGLNRDRILKKAIERGLVRENEADLTDEQIYRFIFEPAFSTADRVSEISGRGVGMDVVRQNIEKLRGKIDLKSEEGQGTTFVLRIPLTLAILDGVTFDIGGTHYSVPTTDLVTFQSYDPASITRTSADHHGFQLRDEVIPIVQYEHRDEIPEHGVVIVLQSNGRRAALVVDRIVGYRQFVVRAVPAYIQKMRAVSGCSIQGDGGISFIIDVAELVSEELESVGAR